VERYTLGGMAELVYALVSRTSILRM